MLKFVTAGFYVVMCYCSHAMRSNRNIDVVNNMRVRAETVNVSVNVANDSPYDIEHLVLIHKYNGADPNTHVAVFSDIQSKAVSSPQKVLTDIGWNAMREDWWLLSWRFKRSEGRRCPCCIKEDQSCESYITDGSNAFTQFFMDPVSYVKIGGLVANGVVTGLSLGTATTASVAATSLLTDVITDALTADENTDGFKACGLNSIDYENSQAGRPVTLRITPNFKVGDHVTWTSHDNDVPEGIVGRVIEVLDADPDDEYRVRAEFPKFSPELQHSGAFCDGSKELAKSGASLQQCEALVWADRQCSDVFHGNGNECLCVRKKVRCNIKTSKVGNSIYKTAGQARNNIWKFKVHSLRFTFRPGDVVTKKKNSDGMVGLVSGYTYGFIEVKWGGRLKELHEATSLEAQPRLESEPIAGMPEFKVEILLHKEGDMKLEIGKGAASKAVRWACDTTAVAMPCAVDSVSPKGAEVPISVTNRGKRTIKSFAVLHKFNGLDPSVHIVDSEKPLPVGSSSWVVPKGDSAVLKHLGSYCDGSKILATSGTTLPQCRVLVQEDPECREVFHTNGHETEKGECLCVRVGSTCNVRSSRIGNSVYGLKDEGITGKRLVVVEDNTPIFASADSWYALNSLKKGDMVTAAGPPTKDPSGYTMVPIKPYGAIQWKKLEVLDHPDPAAVRTDTGFGFHNDWWTMAWTYEGDSETACEVHAAMDMDFLSELVSNPEQKLLNIAVGVVSFSIGIPILWSGAIDVGKYSVEKYVRNQNDMEGVETKPASRLFGIELLRLLASTSSTRGYRKCNLSKKDVQNAQNGKAVQIVIHEDRIEILADGGDRKCVFEIAEMKCLHTEKCFQTDTCRRLNERTEFAKPTAISM